MEKRAWYFGFPYPLRLPFCTPNSKKHPGRNDPAVPSRQNHPERNPLTLGAANAGNVVILNCLPQNLNSPVETVWNPESNNRGRTSTF